LADCKAKVTVLTSFWEAVRMAGVAFHLGQSDPHPRAALPGEAGIVS